MEMRRSFKIAVAAATAVLLLTAALAIASPGSGVTGVLIRADGTVDGRFKVNIPGTIKLETRVDLHVVNQDLTILPLGFTGWHSHPGPVLVTVRSGTLRYQLTDCSFTDYVAGDTFVDPGGGHVHIGRNPSATVNTELSSTYLLPAGTPLRIEADAITCP
jgi:hypothetical protein